MKQNLRGQAFVAFCVFSGQNLNTERVRIREIAATPKKIFATRDEFGL